VSGNAHEFILNTGSPHYVRFVQDLKAIDIIEEGKKIRYSEVHKAEGINVNIVEVNEDYIDVQTYERGVEWETLSCGTGVTACALAFHLYTNQTNSTNEVKILTKGGSLRVQFEYNAQSGKFSNIWLIGPAELVYEGIWND
jgi:diaminopimelate epimerase